eukprot:2817743-Pleurochrysis_carterae.AAC.1
MEGRPLYATATISSVARTFRPSTHVNCANRTNSCDGPLTYCVPRAMPVVSTSLKTQQTADILHPRSSFTHLTDLSG